MLGIKPTLSRARQARDNCPVLQAAKILGSLNLRVTYSVTSGLYWDLLANKSLFLWAKEIAQRECVYFARS